MNIFTKSSFVKIMQDIAAFEEKQSDVYRN